jgi:AraC family transcriptional regulator
MNLRRSHRYEERLLRVLRHMQRHLDDDLSLETLARVACMSPFHFHRVFHAMMGETLGAHIRRLKLERAAVSLRRPGIGVTEAAFDAGYDSVEAFGRAFRAAFDAAPSVYRRRVIVGNRAHAPSGVHFHSDASVSHYRPPRTNRGDDPMTVRYEIIDALPVAAIRHAGPYRHIGRAFARLDAWAAKTDAFAGNRWLLAVYHDDPSRVPEAELRSDACVQVAPGFKGDGEVKPGLVPAGKYAVKLYRGPYEGLGEAWSGFIREWAIDSGIEIDDRPCFERYLNTPAHVAPEDLVTDLYLPVKA